MASVFTYDPDPPRVSSPWSTPGCTTPRRVPSGNRGAPCQEEPLLTFDPDDPNFLADNGITKLDAEPQDGPTEYKLHLLLRSRRSFLSLSTGNLTSGSSHSKPSPVGPESPPVSSEPVARPAQALSSQSREHRLQQLTTQLLWRLQQSSPFHSSSTLGLVLPVLPEATPTLGVPSKPARLLPGLEESQGALYEIGVSDDGTFVGLAEDELEESLTNLKAMAASLGCTVEVLRKVAVGHCEWNENADDDSKPVVLRSGKLWVAEALVSPDFKQSDQLSPGDEKRGSLDSKVRAAPSASAEDEAIFSTPQLHIAMAGPSAAGKSSLLGSLSTSALDNGRGKSRLSLLKHRHEIASGITSSVAQELIGYSPTNTKGAEPTPDVVNYASGNVTAWNDIHASAQGGRLVFLSDLPGSTRYLKSTLRGLVGWEPHYVLLCIPANSPLDSSRLDVPSELDLSLSYLDLCMKLDLPVIVVVTKLDIATRSGIRQTLVQILSTIKLIGRKPVMLAAPTEASEQEVNLQQIPLSDQQDVDKTVGAEGSDWLSNVPIVITSCVTGAGIGKLHALLRTLPIPTRSSTRPIPISGKKTAQKTAQHEAVKLFDITEVFEVPALKVYSVAGDSKRQYDRAIILCGRVRRGNISIGDQLVVGPLMMNSRTDIDSSHLVPRSKPLVSRSLPEELATFYLQNGHADNEHSQTQQARWQVVRVVSLRNLRLPVTTILEHQIGTIGVDSVETTSCLGSIRKGMVLADFHPISSHLSIPSPLLAPVFHTGFVAIFPALNFTSTLSSSLIMGGNAIVYIASIRAAAKVTCVEANRNSQTQFLTGNEEIFSLDADTFPVDKAPQPTSLKPVANNGPEMSNGFNQSGDVSITFSFVSTVEWIELNSRVLAMPGTAMVTTSSSVPAAPGSLPLKGFVGRVCKVLSD
ncbi:elongation factor Tu GTP binding domain-containing protein [Histoplasma ohiense]|nr:elongation factor Tu GTP binding domain-containing protein [Histoplasma ohiense (nom. inval.)]